MGEAELASAQVILEEVAAAEWARVQDTESAAAEALRLAAFCGRNSLTVPPRLATYIATRIAAWRNGGGAVSLDCVFEAVPPAQRQAQRRSTDLKYARALRRMWDLRVFFDLTLDEAAHAVAQHRDGRGYTARSLTNIWNRNSTVRDRANLWEGLAARPSDFAGNNALRRYLLRGYPRSAFETASLSKVQQWLQPDP